MSEHEMLEQKVRLRIEIEQTEKHLAALRERAKTYGDFFLRIGRLLKDSPEVIAPGRGMQFTDSERKSLEVLSLQEVTNAICNEIARLTELRERLAAL